MPQFNYRNGTMYSSTVANSYTLLYGLAQKYNINLVGAVTWGFEFEEQPYFAGFRDLSTNGIAKPVLNVFRIFGQMGGKLVEVSSSGMLPIDSICKNSVRNSSDVGVLASRKEHSATILLWNYHDLNNLNVNSAKISLTIEGCNAQEPVLVNHFRVDNKYSNSYSKWREMGCPKSPDKKTIRRITTK